MKFWPRMATFTAHLTMMWIGFTGTPCFGITAPEISLPARAKVHKTFLISRSAAEGALRIYFQRQGWNDADVSTSQILDLRGATALVENPAIQVTRSEFDRRRGVLQAHLRCARRVECGSFLVDVSWPRKFWADHDQDVTAGKEQDTELPALLHPGEHAALILATDHMRITLPVVCLQAGWSGEQIRVRDARGTRVYRAEVGASGQLRAAP